ncbi:hypothetical protein EST38_g6144 [Candolleomyces aberdarensis]|uniref:Uncharacterized protein n=1 Tax=Candolleomyces aberdarensis TaxID=2316362 RepID=A0A4V1Q3T5_9AGAR|nr:hypothetical protein EST38_g6144 [Candolleomyces aberdarensis]
MAPAEFFVRLQKGIVGGFAPPIPDAIYSLSKSSDQPHLNVTAAVRPEGKPQVEEAAPKQLNHDDEIAKLVGELETILKDLPTEQPPGSEDIYGLNTGIVFGSETLQWVNGGPEGCGGGPGSSTVQPTPEQKEQFKRAVEIVEEIVSKSN